MTQGLTARQTQILKALVDEYIETAEPVGSEGLEKKYAFGVSPATIRNEMAELSEMEFLRQPHTSAGRIPTPKAMRFYVDQLMEERKMSLTEEVKTKEEVWDARGDLQELMREATQALAERTESLAVSSLEGNRVWHAGYANVFHHPEFMDLEMSANVFSLLEEARRIHEIFFERMTGESPVEIIFGEDLGWRGLDYLGIAGARFRLHDRECAIGVVGPTRLSYPSIVPTIRYFRELLTEVSER